MDRQIHEEIPILPPHRYPVWIIIFAVGIVIATVYSLALSPKYLAAAKKMRAAKIAYHNANYDESIQLYSRVLDAVPSSKAAKIGMAEVIFSNNDKSDDELGLVLLDGVNLDEAEWARITRVMPDEYQKYFEAVAH